MDVEISVASITEARRITERIRMTASTVAESIEKLKRLVFEAKQGRVHEVLGFASWTAYLADVLGDQPLRLERDVRQELVAELSSQGMSTRAIAPIVGAGFKTVARDIEATQGVSYDTPAPSFVSASEALAQHESEPDADPDTGEIIDAPTITGMDGKTYQRPAPTPPRPEPITGQFNSVVVDLNRVMARFHRITEQPAYARNTAAIAELYRNDLLRAAAELTTIANNL